MENTDERDKPERASILWMNEAIAYLCLDRLGIARPDLAMHRLIRKGALHPKKAILEWMEKETDVGR